MLGELEISMVSMTNGQNIYVYIEILILSEGWKAKSYIFCIKYKQAERYLILMLLI